MLRAALRASRDQAGGRVVIESRHLALGPTAIDDHAVVGAAPIDRALPLREAVDAFTRHSIEQAVAGAGGNWADAARALGVHRGNLHRLAKRLGLKH